MTNFPLQSPFWGRDFQPQTFDLSTLKDNAGMKSVLDGLLKDGLCFIKGVSHGRPDDVWDLAKALLVPQGGGVVNQAFWDARELKEAAYLNKFTNSGVAQEGYHVSYGPAWLPPHTDGTYIETPPRVKVLGTYALSAEPIKNTFVDGYAILDQLSAEDREIAKNETVTHWIKSDPESLPMQWERTVVGVDENGRETIAWNAHDRNSKTQTHPLSERLEFVLQDMEERINDPANAFHIELRPGLVAIFDNWRVLHGRQTLKGGTRKMAGVDVANHALLGMWKQLLDAT